MKIANQKVRNPALSTHLHSLYLEVIFPAVCIISGLQFPLRARHSVSCLEWFLRLTCVLPWYCMWYWTMASINSLAPGRFEGNFRYLIVKLILVTDGWGISLEIALQWLSLDHTVDKSTLVQVMTWCPPCPYFNVTSVKPQLHIGHGWVITSHRKLKCVIIYPCHNVSYKRRPRSQEYQSTFYTSTMLKCWCPPHLSIKSSTQEI